VQEWVKEKRRAIGRDFKAEDQFSDGPTQNVKALGRVASLLQ
jgi:hypothetical protein